MLSERLISRPGTCSKGWKMLHSLPERYSPTEMDSTTILSNHRTLLSSESRFSHILLSGEERPMNALRICLIGLRRFSERGRNSQDRLFGQSGGGLSCSLKNLFFNHSTTPCGRGVAFNMQMDFFGKSPCGLLLLARKGETVREILSELAPIGLGELPEQDSNPQNRLFGQPQRVSCAKSMS